MSKDEPGLLSRVLAERRELEARLALAMKYIESKSQNQLEFREMLKESGPEGLKWAEEM